MEGQDPARGSSRRSALRSLRASDPFPPRSTGLWASGRRASGIAGLVLALSAFMGWYVGSGEGPTVSVIGWHTGTLGKLVFFLGLAILVLVVLRETGIRLPASVPESLLVIAIGAVATIFVLIQLVSIPDEFLPADGRGVGIWISLAAAVALILAGLLEAGEDL